MSSIVTLFACSRCALATQSAAVSPAPITTTCLPAAVGLPGGGGRRLVGAVARRGDRAVAGVEVLHREVDAVEVLAVDAERALDARADRQDDRVMLASICGRLDLAADVDAVQELDALGLEQRDAPVDDPLLELEVGHAEAQQAAGRLVALVDDDVVAAAVELVRRGEPGRARADDGDGLAGAERRRLRLDPALRERALDDRPLDLLDHHRVVVDLERAGGLARRRADQAGELGEVVGAVQAVDRRAPAAGAREVVPLGDQVADRAGVVAERDPAVHAAVGLAARLGDGQRQEDLAVVGGARPGVALGRGDALDLEEAALAQLAFTAGSSSMAAVVATGSSRSIARR